MAQWQKYCDDLVHMSSGKKIPKRFVKLFLYAEGAEDVDSYLSGLYAMSLSEAVRFRDAFATPALRHVFLRAVPHAVQNTQAFKSFLSALVNVTIPAKGCVNFSTLGVHHGIFIALKQDVNNAELASLFLRALMNVTSRRADIFATPALLDVLLQVAPFATNDASVQRLVRVISNIAGGSSHGLIFATPRVRDGLFALAKYVDTPETARCSFRAISEIFATTPPTLETDSLRAEFATATLRDEVYIRLARLVTTDDIVMWMMKSIVHLTVVLPENVLQVSAAAVPFGTALMHDLFVAVGQHVQTSGTVHYFSQALQQVCLGVDATALQRRQHFASFSMAQVFSRLRLLATTPASNAALRKAQKLVVHHSNLSPQHAQLLEIACNGTNATVLEGSVLLTVVSADVVPGRPRHARSRSHLC